MFADAATLLPSRARMILRMVSQDTPLIEAITVMWPQCCWCSCSRRMISETRSSRGIDLASWKKRRPLCRHLGAAPPRHLLAGAVKLASRSGLDRNCQMTFSLFGYKAARARRRRSRTGCDIVWRCVFPLAPGAGGRTCAARRSAEIFSSSCLIASRSPSKARCSRSLAAFHSAGVGNDNAMITTSVSARHRGSKYPVRQSGYPWRSTQ
jgi:hypothetical protein